MPPFFVEKNIGIQKFKHDPSLSDDEIAMVAKWVDSGAPRGNPADMPKPLEFDGTDKWTIGEPDLILRSKDVTVPAIGPDKWGDFGLIPTGLTEDRYVSAVEVREVNDIPHDKSATTVGGRYVFHHMTYESVVEGERASSGANEGGGSWPIHEVGRNADIFPPEAGRLLAAHSSLVAERRPPPLERPRDERRISSSRSSSSRRATSRSTSDRPCASATASTSTCGRTSPARSSTPTPCCRSTRRYITFEPHLHAPGVRMCLEAIWGHNIQTLNCVGYDHNWVKQYVYDDDAAPLLPKGTIVHLIGFLDTTAANKNPVDPRNWAGGGRRSVANMFIDLGYSVSLTEDQFQAEMAKRRKNDEEPQRLRHRLSALLGAADRDGDADRRDARAPAGSAVMRRLAGAPRRSRRSLMLAVGERADAVHLLERPGRLAGLRRLAHRRRRLA